MGRTKLAGFAVVPAPSGSAGSPAQGGAPATWLRNQMLAGTPEQYADRVAGAPPWAGEPADPDGAGTTANPANLVRPMGADTWVVNAQYSESFLPRIFRILRDFLLTTP